jgi:hypothetical protein
LCHAWPIELAADVLRYPSIADVAASHTRRSLSRINSAKVNSMNMSVNNAHSTTAVQSQSTPSPERQAFIDLAKSLRTGDLPAARKAYSEVVKNAPKDAGITPGGPFAEVGKSLIKGDLAGAQEAFRTLLRGAVGKGGGVAPQPPAPVASTTGGTAGALLSVVA